MDWAAQFGQSPAHLAAGLGHADRVAGLEDDFTGLMLPLARRSVEPVAARQAGARSATARTRSRRCGCGCG